MGFKSDRQRKYVMGFLIITKKGVYPKLSKKTDMGIARSFYTKKGVVKYVKNLQKIGVYNIVKAPIKVGGNKHEVLDTPYPKDDYFYIN